MDWFGTPTIRREVAVFVQSCNETDFVREHTFPNKETSITHEQKENGTLGNNKRLRYHNYEARAV